MSANVCCPLGCFFTRSKGTDTWPSKQSERRDTQFNLVAPKHATPTESEKNTMSHILSQIHKRKGSQWFPYFLEVVHHSPIEQWALLKGHSIHWWKREEHHFITDGLHWKTKQNKTKNMFGKNSHSFCSALRLCGKTYKINGWSQAGLVVFFKTEVLNLCGGSSSLSTHRGFMLPANTAENSLHHGKRNSVWPEISLQTHSKIFLIK